MMPVDGGQGKRLVKLATTLPRVRIVVRTTLSLCRCRFDGSLKKAEQEIIGQTHTPTQRDEKPDDGGAAMGEERDCVMPHFVHGVLFRSSSAHYLQQPARSDRKEFLSRSGKHWCCVVEAFPRSGEKSFV